MEALALTLAFLATLAGITFVSAEVRRWHVADIVFRSFKRG